MPRMPAPAHDFPASSRGRSASPDPPRITVLANAIEALQANRFDLAETLCAPLARRDPNDTPALLLLGLAAGASGHVERAALLLHSAASGRGEAAHPVNDLIAILHRTGQSGRIEPQYRAVLRLDPADVALLHGLANVLHDDGRGEEAVPLLTEALRLQPLFLPARNLLAIVHADAGRTGAAIAQLRIAAEQAPREAGVWANLGLLLKDDGRFDEALGAYDTAIALAPDDAQIRVNRVVALLRSGQWTKAWPDYEWRLSLAGAQRPRLLPALSRFPGLLGLTILAMHEDGFGDTLHFARYLPLLAARGARVVACVPPPLQRLLRTVPGVSEVCGMDEPLPAHDFQCPFFSLPRVFETTPDTIPAQIPYLLADPVLTEVWNRRLPARPPLGELRVGLVWAGQARPMLPGFATLDGRRSMALATLAPLARVAGVVFVSLQHGPEAAQARSPSPGMVLFDPMPGVADFADTAAIVANLDLVISVDTSVGHLAGGMGKPVFLLDRYDHCWRWLSGRADSPWYPGMRIFRQTCIGDWDPVVRDVTRALREFTGLGPSLTSCFRQIHNSDLGNFRG
jgi:tetratricopeptide (TPR) repeat protein